MVANQNANKRFLCKIHSKYGRLMQNLYGERSNNIKVTSHQLKYSQECIDHKIIEIKMVSGTNVDSCYFIVDFE